MSETIEAPDVDAARAETAPTSDDTDHRAPTAPAISQRRRRGRAVVVAVIVVVLVGGAVAFALTRRSDSGAATKTTLPTQVVAVTKQDLATYTPYTGTLGFGDPITINEAGLSSGTASTPTGSTGGAAASSATSGAGTTGAPASTGGGGATSSTGTASKATTAPTTTPTTAPASDIVTSVAAEGTTINRGDVIDAVDDEPRVSFYGLTPAYRDLSEASTPGTDVLELEQNLVVLGYDPDHRITVDTTFDDGTLQAVERWQTDHGYAPTGTVKLGQIVFLPGPVRIGSHQLDVGGVARPGTPVTQATELATVLTVFPPTSGAGAGSPRIVDGLPAPGTALATGATVFTVNGQPVTVSADEVVAAGPGLHVGAHHVENGATVGLDTPVVELEASHRQVTANVSVTDRATLKVGDAVRVVFPDSSQKPGTIAAIGSVAAKTSNNANAAPTVPVTVVLADGQVDPNLVSTPVEVDFTQQSVAGALAVPTAALVALKEGGFAVQVQDGNGGTRLVGVQPGIYSDNLVQITGNGISEGTKVLMPS